ncbi:MAG: Xaa-Pro peptidase family protein [Anaerolineales bacterium]
MQSRNLDALLVVGPAQHNPAMTYLTGGGHVTSAVLVKWRGEEAVLFYNPMEREEAAATGLACRDLSVYDFQAMLREANGRQDEAQALRLARILQDLGVTGGRVALEGRVDLGANFAIFSALQRQMPEITLVGEVGDSVLLQARATKSEAEVERIRRMGQITTTVVGRTADFLSGQRARQDGVLLDSKDQPVTIGRVKALINLWLAELGAENPEGTIFAQGRDAGIPHSTGNPQEALRTGQTIVFDIFPCEAGGGYFYDFTRTWCLGYAPDEALALYEQVHAVYAQVMSELRMGEYCKRYQIRACELFEAQGHPTVQSQPRTQEGYVHSLGHGLGLDVHEAPWFGNTAANEDRLEPGVVVTIEPGLYYPEHGMGCRLEDTVWARPDGGFEVLAEYPLDLVIPVGKER